MSENREKRVSFFYFFANQRKNNKKSARCCAFITFSSHRDLSPLMQTHEGGGSSFCVLFTATQHKIQNGSCFVLLAHCVGEKGSAFFFSSAGLLGKERKRAFHHFTNCPLKKTKKNQKTKTNKITTAAAKMQRLRKEIKTRTDGGKYQQQNDEAQLINKQLKQNSWVP
jgi:hypothetical protein